MKEYLVKRSFSLAGHRTSVALEPEFLKGCDAVVITTAHKNNVDYDIVRRHAPLVFDTKNVMGGTRSPNVIQL